MKPTAKELPATARLVCPVCKGALACSAEWIQCRACDREFRQNSDRYVELLPAECMADLEWLRRQSECDGWYGRLIENPTQAFHCYFQDYSPHAEFLHGLTGAVLDVGGGNGVVRHFMPAISRYVNVEPSLAWLDVDWTVLKDQFPCLEKNPEFVRAVGEHLPFADGEFDAVLSFWSLNHVVQPDAVIGEMARVLKPEGKLLVVLEDMPPTWGDLAGPLRRSRGMAEAGRLAGAKLRAAFRAEGWTLQSDHIRIEESALRRWAAERVQRVRRAWVGAYLTYEFRRT